MAFAMVVEVPDITREQYEMVTRKMSESGALAGSIFHAGGPVEGGFRLFEVWESREAADAFYGGEALRAATAALPHPKVVMTWPVYGVGDLSGWRAID